ncbi:MAG: T9SS type A sorting domain-containing protein [Saprospiraceae bacterium]|nr:T9SS type A sorting domain-containing protein [Candidatus Defluviibacterium haderslevense]
MKTLIASKYSLISWILINCIVLLLLSGNGYTQTFQRIYGTSLDNSFSKVIPDGTEYYVLGQDQPSISALPRATVTRLAADGSILWTKSLDIPSQWNDAIRVKKGDLILVGNSLPGDATAKSIMGRITATGTYTWLKSYDDLGGRDIFLRIIENPVPQNTNYPYYILGAQLEILGLSQTWDDVVMMNINDNGNFNWKKIYTSNSDDEFFRDFLVLPNGEMLISGSRLNRQSDHSGIFFATSNDGSILSGKIATWMNYPDIALAQSGGFYMASNSEVGQSPFISKFDQNYTQIWQVQIPKLTTISQIWEASPGIIYTTGVGSFGSLTRTVILKLQDNTPNIPTLLWTKYYNSGINFIGGSLGLMPTNQLAFTDGRMTNSGFGAKDAFISISDLELNTCDVSNETVSLTPTNLAPINQIIFPINTTDTVAGVNISNSFITWGEKDPCQTCCADSTTFSNLVNQGFTVVITNCKVTVTAPQFDTCHLFSTPPSLDGANVSQVITNPNGSWTYNFTQNGTHQICVNVFDECNSKKMCTLFNITACDTCICGPFDLKYNIGRGPLLPYDCGDTLLVPASTAILPIHFLSSFTCLDTNCPQTTVDLILTGPPGFIPITISSVQATPNFNIPFTNSTFSITGIYTLTINGHCGSNICPCIIYFNADGHDCCSNPFDFELGIANAVTLTVDNNKCKATLNIGNLPNCDSIGPIFWGDGTSTSGHFGAGTMTMHSYVNSGTYYISWTALEYDYSVVPPKPCFDKVFRDSIKLICDTCQCKSFSLLSFVNPNWPTAIIPVSCNTLPMQLPCSKSGQNFFFQGNLNCNASNCIRDSIHWNIMSTIGGQIITSGTTDINSTTGQFNINLNSTWFSSGVQYMLNISGQCGSNICVCKINFSFANCPCPCDSLNQDVLHGFFVSGNSSNCNRTIKPKDLCSNDKITWSVSPSITPIPGNSIGNNSQIFQFSIPGIYTVCMSVTRIDPVKLDTCRAFYCRKVTVNCFPNPHFRLCESSTIKNGDFTEGLVKGVLSKSQLAKSRGKIANWTLFPNDGDGLVIVEDSSGASDDGSVLLIGNKNNFAGIWQQVDLPVDKYINIGFDYINYKRNRLLDHLLAVDIVMRLQSDSTLNPASSAEILRKAMKDKLDDKENSYQRFDTSINDQHDPILKYLVICLQNQNDSVMSVIGIDNIEMCSSRVPIWVSTHNEQQKRIRIYPNPNNGHFSIEMQHSVTSEMIFQIIDVTGRNILEKRCDPLIQTQNIDASILDSGLYFLQVISKGKIIAVEKLIKQ